MANYLDLHQSRWRARVVVPQRLSDKLGKTVLLWQTGESDFDRAKRVAAPVIKRFLAQIAKADGRRPGARFLRDSRAETRSVEWFTPPRIFECMPGVEFDLDPASPGRDRVPWVPARRHITKDEDGLAADWGDAFCWLNPPFGAKEGLRDWLDKFLRHGNGVALLPSNSYTRWWHHIADRSDAIFFIRGYVQFLSPAGPVRTRACFGSNMFAVGRRGVDALRLAAANGLGTIIVRADPESAMSAGIHASAPRSTEKFFGAPRNTSQPESQQDHAPRGVGVPARASSKARGRRSGASSMGPVVMEPPPGAKGRVL